MAGPGARRGLVPLLAFLGVMAYAFAMAVIAPALPLIKDGLGTSEAGAAWAMTAMMLSAGVATPVVGRLGDMYGPRPVLLVVLVVTATGMVVAASAGTLGVMLVGRVLAGVGGGVFPLAFTIVREVFPPDRTASAVGLMSSMLGAGGGLSWCVAGPIIDGLGWRWLLWVPVMGLVPGLVAAYWIVPDVGGGTVVRIDWWGGVLFAGWLAIGLAALTQATAWGWGAVGLGCSAAALAVVWFAVERRVERPLVDLRLMRRRAIWTANVASLLSGYALLSGGLLFPLLVQLPEENGFGFGATATQAALLQLPSSAAMTVAGLTAGMLHRVLGSRVILVAGAVLTAAGYGFVTFEHETMGQLYTGSVVRGLGIGLAYAAVANLVVAAVPAGETGLATGVNTLTRTVGAAVGTQVSAVIVAASGAAESGFTLGFAVSAGVMGAVLVMALLTPGRGPKLKGWSSQRA
ncbi:MFS transporter [Actinomadura sp. NBRC 104412]|nr:MFS transporter [Actinomadura sp. NBRC 104412]